MPIQSATFETRDICKRLPVLCHRNAVNQRENQIKKRENEMKICDPVAFEDEGMLAGINILQNQ